MHRSESTVILSHVAVHISKASFALGLNPYLFFKTCGVVDPVMVDQFGFLFNCTTTVLSFELLRFDCIEYIVVSYVILHIVHYCYTISTVHG